MPDPVYMAASLTIGACAAIAALTAVPDRSRSDARAWLNRRQAPPPARRSLAERLSALRGEPRLGQARQWLQVRLERAGWKETPERYAAGTTAASGCVALAMGGAGALIDGGTAAVLAALGAAAAVAASLFALLAASARRRELLLGELAPLLELVALDLSSGVSAQTAIASVVSRAGGPLAGELRRQLAASQVVGSAPFESRLILLGRRLDLPPLVALGSVMATAREYGSGVAPGVRVLATDLRRAQRRRLIMLSRRALNRVLVPSAVGVLLPFMAVLLFPALATLAHSAP